MRTSKILHVFTALAVLTFSLFSLVSTAGAEGYATVGTTLTIVTPTSVSVGSPTMIVLHLITSKNEPAAHQRVEFFIDGKLERTAKTDAAGNASIKVQRDLAGSYKLSATFKGSKLPSLGSSKTSAVEWTVTPALIEIHTTPSLPNIKFSLDNHIFSSDEYGVARIEVKKAGKYRLELLPVELKDANIQMGFDRWGDEIFKPSREIDVPLSKPLEIGFAVSYQVSQTFVDLLSRPVDPSRVTSITLKGSNGTTYTFEDTKPHWLPAGRVIRLNNGLEQTKILYSIISIVIDGSNVVSQAQQRFYVNPDDVWTVKLLLYKARFTARDALFGFPIGSGIRMEYPDGKVRSYPFNPSEGYAIDGLARGIYRVKVTGAKGYAPVTPIALSRDQDVELMVFSYIDLGVFLALGLLLSLGLLLFGRPYLLSQAGAFGRRLIPRSQPATQAAQAETADS
ncbi:MAG TPA: Ig-like domain-containing protein, partial [Anaerolineales bacterium]|nr:Ig-like domain-containing protein [Anaerolineales bacterium]